MQMLLFLISFSFLIFFSSKLTSLAGLQLGSGISWVSGWKCQRFFNSTKSLLTCCSLLFCSLLCCVSVLTLCYCLSASNAHDKPECILTLISIHFVLGSLSLLHFLSECLQQRHCRPFPASNCVCLCASSSCFLLTSSLFLLPFSFFSLSTFLFPLLTFIFLLNSSYFPFHLTSSYLPLSSPNFPLLTPNLHFPLLPPSYYPLLSTFFFLLLLSFFRLRSSFDPPFSLFPYNPLLFTSSFFPYLSPLFYFPVHSSFFQTPLPQPSPCPPLCCSSGHNIITLCFHSFSFILFSSPSPTSTSSFLLIPFHLPGVCCLHGHCACVWGGWAVGLLF